MSAQLYEVSTVNLTSLNSQWFGWSFQVDRSFRLLSFISHAGFASATGDGIEFGLWEDGVLVASEVAPYPGAPAAGPVEIATDAVVLNPGSTYVLAARAAQVTAGLKFMDRTGFDPASALTFLDGLTFLEGLTGASGPPASSVGNRIYYVSASVEVFVPERAVASPLDRYRSSVSADSGSLLATTRAVPFDTSHTIAFSPAAELDQDALYPFFEATSAQSGQPDVLFYPRARQSLGGPIEYDGVTILTLMERVFPAQILTRTEDVSLPALATAQEIITYVFQQWANAYPWFTYKAVPDLRLRSVSVTGDWSGVLALRTTVLRDSVIRVRQSPTSPRSMLAMLEGLLSPFPGTQYFMDSDGDLVIRPVYGPDADATPYKTLDDGDVRTISIGEPSVDQIRNRATGSFQRYTEADDVSVLQPAFLQVASNYMRDASFLPGPPVTDYLVSPPTDRLDLSTDDAGFGGWRTIPLGENVVIGDDPIAFEDSGGPLIVAVVNTYDSAGTLQESWTSPGDLTVEVHNTVPLDGSTVLAFTVWRVVGDTSNAYYGRWNARWNAAENAVQIQWAGGGLEVNTFSSGTLRAAQMSITINGVARAWAEGATISATFGIVDEGDFVPGPDGTNALAASVTAYGVIEERFTIEGYGALAISQLERIVEAFVIENLTPRATRELALTWKGAVGLEFDDRGRLVGFPGDGEGFLTGRQFGDDFLANAGGVTVKIEETVPASPGTIDFEAIYLLAEDGGFWINEDASASPPA